MYMVVKQRIFCLPKTAYVLGIILLMIAVFYNMGMTFGSASETIVVLKGFVQRNIVSKEQSNALLLLNDEWEKKIALKYSDSYVKKIENGVVYISLKKKIASRNIKINVVEVNKAVNPKIDVIPQIASSDIHSRKRINKITGQDVLAAVNGTYFSPKTGTPLGALVINKKIVSGSIYDRVGLIIKEDGYDVRRISFNGKIRVGNRKINIDNINRPRMMFKEVLVYTQMWGKNSPASKKGIVNVAIKDNVVIAKSKKSIEIPSDGYVISAPQRDFELLQVGMKVGVNYSLSVKDGKHIVSGGPYLMKDGKIFVDTKSEKLTSITGRNPRTAVGYTKEGVLIMVTIDGRKEGSSGVTLEELAKIMKDLGCYEAINLDGGSSTVMYVDGVEYRGTTQIARINNAIVVRGLK